MPPRKFYGLKVHSSALELAARPGYRNPPAEGFRLPAVVDLPTAQRHVGEVAVSGGRGFRDIADLVHGTQPVWPSRCGEPSRHEVEQHTRGGRVE